MKKNIKVFAAMIAVAVKIKKKTDFLIVRLTNLKAYATLESIIMSIAN